MSAAFFSDLPKKEMLGDLPSFHEFDTWWRKQPLHRRGIKTPARVVWCEMLKNVCLHRFCFGEYIDKANETATLHTYALLVSANAWHDVLDGDWNDATIELDRLEEAK